MLLQRPPSPPLRPFIATLWAGCTDSAQNDSVREHALPTGQAHLVFRLSDTPLRLFRNGADPLGHTIGSTLVGGPRAAHYIRTAGRSYSVGAQLRPGAVPLLLGVPAHELAGRHCELSDLWGAAATLLREQLIDAAWPERQLALLESALLARLPRVRGLHPPIAQALALLNADANIDAAVRASGYSHRTFIAQFRRAVGLTPKLYCRVLRFGRAVRRLAAASDPASDETLADLALAFGYSDQAHFSREFIEFAGVTPRQYRLIAPAHAHHLPLPPRPR
jgi:AraC-like DNA-binding protein